MEDELIEVTLVYIEPLSKNHICFALAPYLLSQLLSRSIRGNPNHGFHGELISPFFCKPVRTLPYVAQKQQMNYNNNNTPTLVVITCVDVILR